MMEKQALKAVLDDASQIVAELPQHLQEKAFELAAKYLAGDVALHQNGSGKQPAPKVHRADAEHDGPEVSDLLKVVKQNPDRYVIFLNDIEAKGESATTSVIEQRFASYRQDRPKKIARDLQNLAANDWAEVNAGVWTLKRKGRQRHDELIALVSAEA